MSEKNSYRQVFKATSMFGGVQVINILTLIVRGKAVALFLGPVGMGISGLLVTTVTLVSSITSLGLNYSAVRDISIANGTGDVKQLSETVIIFRRWLYLSCLLGILILIAGSPLLSQMTFGNREYTWSFIFLSLLLVFTTLNNGNIALLEGTRSLKATAKSTVIGSILGLITSLPLYYFFGKAGIVPSLLLGAVTVFLIGSFFAKKIKTVRVQVSRKMTLHKGGEMARLGLAMVASQLLGSLVIYLINTFVRSKGGIQDVGLYQAATTVTNQSIGLVFSAMTIDYFPKLAAVSEDKEKVNATVNQQAIITILIASPILIGLIIFAPLAVSVLLSSDFQSVVGIVRWLAAGSLFTAPMVVMGFIALAKGDKKSFFLYGSLFNNIASLVLLTSGYAISGLKGMAIGYFLSQLLYMIFISYKFNKLYGFLYSKEFLKLYIVYVLVCFIALAICLIKTPIVFYLSGACVLIFTSLFSLQKLEKYTSIITTIKDRIRK